MNNILLPVIFRICDILVSIYRKSFNYLFLSFFLPCDISSLENLLLCLVDYNPIFDIFLPLFSIFYYPITNFYIYDSFQISFSPPKDSIFFLKNSFNKNIIDKNIIDKNINDKNLDDKNLFNKNLFNKNLIDKNSFNKNSFNKNTFNKILSIIYYILNISITNTRYTDYYKISQLPSFNVTWFLYTHIFYTYSYLIFNIINIVYVYISLKINYQSKYKLILFFKNSTYKNYLLYFTNSKYLFLYIIIYILYIYVEYLLYEVGIANPNFLNWLCILFISLFINEYSNK